MAHGPVDCYRHGMGQILTSHLEKKQTGSIKESHVILKCCFKHFYAFSFEYDSRNVIETCSVE